MDPEETQGASLDPEETLRAPPDPVEQTQKASSDLEVETKDEAEPVAGAAKLGGPVVPALRKLTISRIFHQILSSRTWRRRLVRASMEGAAPQFFCRRSKKTTGECGGMLRRGLDGVAGEGGDTGADSQGHITGTVNRRQAMNSLEMEEWRKARRKKTCKMVRPNDRLVVGARMLYKREDGDIEKFKCRLVT